MSHSLPARLAPRIGGVLLLVALAGCTSGGDDGDGAEPGSDLAESLGPAETLDALETDADAVDQLVRDTAPALADALSGRVRFAAGVVEGCEGGSFDGATAAGYLVSGRVDPGDGVAGDEAVVAIGEGLAAAGWEVSEPGTDTPGRVTVSGRQGDAELSATVAENLPGQVLFSTSGPCRPVDDASRDDAIGSLAHEVIPRR